MSAHQHEGVRQVLLDAAGHPQRAEALGGEVALQAHDVRLEVTAPREALLDAVDPEVKDPALVPVGLQSAGHVFQAERLDEGDHLQTQDTAGMRFEESDFHDWAASSR